MDNSLLNIIQEIASEALRLKNKYIQEDMSIDWVCVFCKNENEYKTLIDEADKIGLEIESPENGMIYKFNSPITTKAGVPKVFKIRKPDVTKLERGDVDFTTDYSDFKSKYLNGREFKLIKKPNFEMIELVDKGFNVRVYFSSVPPSKLRGVK